MRRGRARVVLALVAGFALALAGAGCAGAPEGRSESLPRRTPTPIAGASVDGVPLRAFFERRAALLVAGATVTASSDGVRVRAPSGGAAAALARDGYLLTTAHSVSGGRVHVYLYGDETWYAPARIVWSGDVKRSPFHDLAIVKVDVVLPGALAWASPEDVTAGADLVGIRFHRSEAPDETDGGVALDLVPGRALTDLSFAEAGAPALSTLLHDVPLALEEGGGALATRDGRLVALHLGTLEGPKGERTGVAVRPDPAWIARRLEEDRRGTKVR